MWVPMVDIVHLEQVVQQQQTVLYLGPLAITSFCRRHESSIWCHYRLL